MKKLIALLLVFAMVLPMCGCGKSKAVKEAETAIKNIGEVTLESGEAIKNAEKLFGILTENEKEKVNNRLALVEAREQYDVLASEVIYEKAHEAFLKLVAAADLATVGADDIYGGAYAAILGLSDKHKTMNYYLPLQTSLSDDDLFHAYNKLRMDGAIGKDDSVEAGVSTVMQAHITRGTYEELDTLLEEANNIIQELNNTYSDEIYYPKLKSYYTSVSVCGDFFKSPSGTFKQLEETITGYKNDIDSNETNLRLMFS